MPRLKILNIIREDLRNQDWNYLEKNHDLRNISLRRLNIDSGKYKLRVSYNANSFSYQFDSYYDKEVHSLKLVVDNEIDYSHKFEDRSAIEKLINMRGGFDDILIIKQGHVTDTSFTNIVFFDGYDWFTPDTPLLEGTRRAALLEQGIIQEMPIRMHDIKQYQSFKLINAMRPFETTPEISCQNIFE